MKTKRLIPRILVSPCILGMLAITYCYAMLKRWVLFIRWGGEFATYDEDSTITLQTIHDSVAKHDKSETKELVRVLRLLTDECDLRGLVDEAEKTLKKHE